MALADTVIQPLSDSASKAADRVGSWLPERWRWLVDYSIAGNTVWRVVALFASIVLALLVGKLLRLGLNAAERRLTARHQLLAAVAAVIEQGPAEPGDLFGTQVEPDRAEGVSQRAAQPLRVVDAERGE